MRSSYSLKFKKLQKYFTYVFVAINIPKANTKKFTIH